MTLLAVGVIVAVTASIIELSIKQVQLSVSARDSEVAFQAANAGMECARYVRRTASSSFESVSPPANINGRCFGNAIRFADTASGITAPNNTSVNYYTEDVSWGGRCSDMKILILINDRPSADMNISAANIRNLFPNYTGGAKTCAAGARCTIASVSGTNKPSCATTGSLDTVRREILLEF